MTDEDDEFDRIEREQAMGWRKRQITNTQTAEQSQMYESGWNSALEMAAYRIVHDFKHAFGEDTVASFAAYIKGLKK
jgi:hypothetical protein